MKFLNSIFSVFNKKVKRDILLYNIIGIDADAHMSLTDKAKANEFVTSVKMFIESVEKDFVSTYTNESNRIAMINTILDRLDQLYQYGKTEKIYMQDFAEAKVALLNLLSRLFGNSETISSLKETVRKLERMQVLPENSEYDFMKITPLSRWL